MAADREEREISKNKRQQKESRGSKLPKIIIFTLILLIGFYVSQRNNPNFQDNVHEALMKLEKYVPYLSDIGAMFHEKKIKAGAEKVKNKKKPKSEAKTQNSISKSADEFDTIIKNGFKKHNKLFTDNDLNPEGKLYLVMLGFVIDVSDGDKYYGPGSGYHGFIGKDGTRAFITGEFNEEGLTSDVSGLESSNYIGLYDWLKFYLNHDTYKHIGFHIGRYFDMNGKPTEEITNFKKWLSKAEQEKEAEEDVSRDFPPCNVEWNKNDGTTFWCSTQSGGIQRSWVGVPREFFQGNGKTRCACLHSDHLSDPRFKLYDGCDPKSERCKGPSPKET